MMDFLWPRLQRVMQNDTIFYETLQEAKNRVDFFVSLLVVTAAFVIIWLIALGFIGYEPLVTAAVGVVGPILCVFWYRMATSSYRVFAEIARSGVDVFRLELLAKLMIAQPENLGAEQSTWQRISRHTGFGENHPLRYRQG